MFYSSPQIQEMAMQTLIHQFEVKFVDEGTKEGTFEGYGAFFKNVDAYGDVIQNGAFKDNLKEWKGAGKLPPMLSQHGGFGMSADDLIPIGKWLHMEEDGKGLFVKGRLINLDTDRGKQIHGAMKEGVLDGMSIGYFAKEFTLGTKPSEPKRLLKKIDLVELSVVTFPANGKSVVTDIKSMKTIRDFEDALLRGTLPPLSLRDAKALLAEGYKAILSERDAGGVDTELMDIIRRNITSLES